ncbi:energy-coupling factor ABC transporter permease [Pseudoalteromonas rubra]|uniref:Energy-coupling factor ABC transporter permease n=1 Tax=Pseudoalteromonas rubra TaxID=43658 RepID=A0A0U3HMW4_9GAMM|nr:energy-coupling factor ABC transporter permease [Pseudoalteromonas rubra]ALU42264.1 hypothetical protein AT705_04490 [Pseudoalteromonas rubra]
MFTALMAVGLFALSFNKQQYQALLQTPARQTGVLACALVLALLWQIQAGILPHLSIHILGITAATLTLGWHMGLLCATLATLLSYFFGPMPIENLWTFWLFTALLPVYLSYGLFLLCYHFLSRHFFVYIFVCAFLCGGLVAASKIAISALYYLSIGLYDWPVLVDNYIFYAIIMWFPEAMLNGMAITLLITYRPHWVKTFYDRDYLDK